MVFSSRLRVGAAMLVLAGLLGLGCKKSSSGATATVSGTVIFTRVPVLRDAVTGSPTGYGAAGLASVSRNVAVRAFQLLYDIGPDGRLHQNWRPMGSTLTDQNGGYAIGSLFRDCPTFVEVDSVFQQSGGNGASVQIIADKDGIASQLPEASRPIYAYRVDAAGVPVPGQNPVAADDTASGTPVAVLGGDATVNLELTASEPWAVTLSNWYVPGSNPSPTQHQSPPLETRPIGSNVLGILDSVYIFSYYYGDPTPSQVKGGVLDLHYYPGRTESPRRSYVIYDTTQAPLGWDGTRTHYFGTLAAGPAVDDAWDPGVIYPMLGRNNLAGQAKTALFPTGRSDLPGLSEDLAVVDGLADGMAATLLASPWLTDTSAAVGLAPRDIRAVPAANGFASPAIVAGVAWELTLRANGVASPGTPATWMAGLTNPSVTARLYSLIYPYVTYQGAHGVLAAPIDISSMYAQVQRLQEAKQGGEPVDLAPLFNNQVLLVMLQPFGVLWPQSPQQWPFAAADWSPDPLSQGPDSATTPLPGFTLSMAGAQLLPNPQIPAAGQPSPPALVYPNVTPGEVSYGKFFLTYDREFTLSVATVPDLATTSAVIEVVVDGLIRSPYRFGAGLPASYTFTLKGNAGDVTNPTRHFVRIRVISPLVVQPDLATTVNLVWTHTP